MPPRKVQAKARSRAQHHFRENPGIYRRGAQLSGYRGPTRRPRHRGVTPAVDTRSSPTQNRHTPATGSGNHDCRGLLYWHPNQARRRESPDVEGGWRSVSTLSATATSMSGSQRHAGRTPTGTAGEGRSKITLRHTPGRPELAAHPTGAPSPWRQANFNRPAEGGESPFTKTR